MFLVKIPYLRYFVFVTAYDQYALKAFKLNSVDYLLKTVDAKELQETFRKIASRSLVQPIHKELLEKLYVKEMYIKRFVIRIGSQIKLVGLDQVTCVYRENRGVYVRVLDERDYLWDETSLEGVGGVRSTTLLSGKSQADNSFGIHQANHAIV